MICLGGKELHNIVNGSEARLALSTAVRLLADSVRGTLGPNARTVLLQQEGRPPSVLNDGVKIVSAVKSNDPAVQASLDLIRQVALEAQQASGDGTTTATILAEALVENYSRVERNPSDMPLFVNHVENKISEMKWEVNMDDEELVDLQRVATIAANNDEWIGELITDMFASIGADGLVNLKVGSDDHTTWSKTTGCEVPMSYASPMFCNNDRRTFEVDNPLFIITKETIEEFDDLTPALEVAIENNRPLVIVCQDIKGVALSNLIANVVGGVVRACALRIPRTDPDEWFDDLSALTGGKIHFESEIKTGISHAVEGAGHFGSAERITVGHATTTIVAGERTEQLQNHISGLANQAKTADHPFSREKLLTRHSRLEQQMATIHIGGFSEAEIRETRERVDDAVNATRLAIKGGVVVGAGWTLYTIAKEMLDNTPFSDALKAPMHTLNNNMPEKNNAFKWGENYYLNTKTDEMEPTESATVLDPALVVLNSLKAAVSIARLVLTTDTIILAEPQEL